MSSVLMTGAYREINQQLHRNRQSYGRSGKKYAPIVKGLKFTDILDYGCGKGTLAKALDFPIHEYDPAIPGKDTLPEPHDLVVCTDVLEHIEPDCLDLVLEHIASMTKQMAFLVICTRKANKTLPDGRNAHLIVENKEWWLDRLDKYFDVGLTTEVGNGELRVLVKPL